MTDEVVGGSAQEDSDEPLEIAGGIDPVAALVLAEAETEVEQRRQAAVADYLYDKSQEKYWDLKTRSLYGPKAVDASVPRDSWRLVVRQVRDPETGDMVPRESRVKPSEDVMRIETNQFVEASTWWPGEGEIIHNKFIDGAGVRDLPGTRLYNTYLPPVKPHLKVYDASVFVNHVMKLFPEPMVHNYILDYFAHTIQHPEVKINTCIVIAGSPKVGKDSCLEPFKHAVGKWNCHEIDPDELMNSQYRPWLQSVVLTINEVRSQKEDFHANKFHNILKPYVAAPPDALALNDKYRNMRYVQNKMRVIITTNEHLSMYLPPEDRRNFVAYSPLPKDWHILEGKPEYFTEYWAWCDNGGNEAVAQYLWDRDISNFDPKKESPKTDAWYEIVGSWHATVDCVEKAMEHLVGGKAKPRVVLGAELLGVVYEDEKDKDELMAVMKSSRKLAHRMNNLGYQAIRCSTANEWLWTLEGTRLRSKVAFVRRDLRLFGEAAEQEVDRHGREVLARRKEAGNVTHLPKKVAATGGF
jgi:hypothetical protein